MEISKAVMMSVVLLSLSAGVMIPPLFQVCVTNFPLDEQGNLKVRIMNEKDLQAYKDSVQVTLLDWSGLPSDQSEYRNDGLYLDGLHPIELPFAFSSKQTFKNVSGLILAFTVYPISHDTKFDITFNGNVTITASIKPHDYGRIDIYTLSIENFNVYQAITPGVNTIHLTNPKWYHTELGKWFPGGFWVYKITVFIEYEYQAK